MLRMATLAALVLVSAALADDDALRSKLTGSWQAQGDAKDVSKWTFERKPDAIHVATSDGSKTLSEFDCKMGGQECDIKDSGHKAKVTVWFLGPKLVETETIGSRVVKRRFAVTGDGDTMEMEIIPIEPQGKTETATFKRVH